MFIPYKPKVPAHTQEKSSTLRVMFWGNDTDLVKNEDSITMHATYKTVVSIITELEFNER
jgi:hypothetical protein